MFKLNDYVYVKSVNSYGNIYSLNKDKVCVICSNKKVFTDILDISISDKKTNNILKESKNRVRINIPEIDKSGFNIELMLRHLDRETSLILLDEHIKKAYSLKIDKIRIVHGKSGKVLKDAVYEYLKDCKFIKSKNYADYFHGQSGVTEVFLKY